MSKIVYLLWSNKHNAWWRSGGWGYTDRVEEAGRFSEDQATRSIVQSAQSGNLAAVTCMVAAPENWTPGTVSPLARNWQEKTVHAQDCAELGDHVVTWAWSAGRTPDEVRVELAVQGGRECQVCKPLGGLA